MDEAKRAILLPLPLEFLSLDLLLLYLICVTFTFSSLVYRLVDMISSRLQNFLWVSWYN